MSDRDKSKQQLIAELEELRQRVDAAERALQEREASAEILQIARLGIHECDTEGRITFVNPSQEAITGYTADELLGTYVWDRLEPGPEKDDLPAYFKRLVSEQPVPTPFFAKNVRRNGEVFDARVDWNFKRNPQGQVTGFVCIVSDITEWKCAEAELRESEKRNRLLMESVPQTIWRADSVGNIVDANRHWSEYSGQTLDEAKGDGWLTALHPDDLKSTFQDIQNALAQGDVYQCEQRMRRKSDGAYRWHLSVGVPVKDDEGKITGWIGSTTDIHDQKCAEETLKRAYGELERLVEARTAELLKSHTELDLFRRFAEASGQGFGMADMNGIITYMNPALCRTAGVAKPEDVIGKHIDNFYPKEYLLKRDTEIVPAVLQKGHWEGELTVSPAGKTTHILQHSFLIKDDQGNPSHLASVITDITERKKAEEALQASEEKYRKLVETLPDGVLLGDLEGRITYASSRVLDMYGTDRAEDVLGRNPLDFLTVECHQKFLADLWRTLETGKIGLQEYPMVRKNGTRFTGEMSAAVIRDSNGNPTALVAVLRDITERKIAEEALRQSHDQLQTIYEGMLEGLLITDIETKRIRRVNSSMCRMLGCDEAELLTKSIPDLHPPEEVPNDLARFQAAAEGQVSINEDRPVLRKDGSLFYADITGHRIIYQGRFSLLALFRDVTERKNAQEALVRQKELETSERFARQRAEELAEADRRKDEFLAMLAHELRNPLAPIRNGIDVLRIVPHGGEQAGQILDTMEQQSDHLVRLVDDLLDVSRVTRGKLELKPQRVALSKIITTAIQMAEPFILSNGHELNVKHAREELHLHGDPTRLAQVIANLLNNAAKYTPPGGRIFLTAERVGDQVAIRVKDNGIGIAPEMLPHIFETFFQADGSLSRRHGGLGLGLTLVKNLVEMHGGTVEAISERLGNGTEFTVRLPILQSGGAVPEEAAVFPLEMKSFPCHNILVVDDVLPAALIIGTLLESFGQNVRAAGSGPEALAMIEQEKPDLVLSDISMPEMDGYELAQAIRRRPEWDDICLVALTGYGQESDKQQAKDAGFNGHLVKPVDKNSLKRLLMSWPYLG